jgi:sugar phosphate isomerase/epimerase
VHGRRSTTGCKAFGTMRLANLDLTYCSNIHAGERWSQVADALADVLPRVRERLGFAGPFGIGLRLSAEAAQSLEDPGTFDRFRAFLADGDYYVPTINGFPYGAFHGTRVKERVYLPDWRSDARVDYTNRLARVLARLTADRGATEASISTVPGAFRAHMETHADVEAIASGILRHACHLKQLRDQHGVSIALALEPEPACQLETTDDAIKFFQEHLFSTTAIAAAGRASGVQLTLDDVRRHVGVCLDACHMAVEFEDAARAIQCVHAAGIRICKAQLSSALRVRHRVGEPTPRQLLEPFSEDTYLHQVVVAGGTGLTRYTDLPEALDAAETSPEHDSEWRVHFHVPIFLATMSGFETTQGFLADMIRALDRSGLCSCFEVETYTWDVLPPEYRTTDVATAIARELAWVRSTLGR